MSLLGCTPTAKACSDCRTVLLRSFLSVVHPGLSFNHASRKPFFNGSIASNETRLNTRRPRRNIIDGISYSPLSARSCRAQIASFATTAAGRESQSSLSNGRSSKDEDGHLEDSGTLEIAARIQNIDEPDYIPWYLRDKTATETTAQHSLPGQDLPEMPSHPPELLQPITTHILETLGLSYVKVLDLRTITEPPPALGSNLIMLLATARSERHLHASADKLCRWLRTEYKLSPVADGLLGRNEMKIAVRRRIRKAKMMTAAGVGGGGEGDIADGIRSDWICVNIGRVAGGVLPESTELASSPKAVGFGTAIPTTTLVVQMMTESKREELDLEGLWEGVKRRQNSGQGALTDTESGFDGFDSPSEIWSTSADSPPLETSDSTGTYTPHYDNTTTRLRSSF